MPLEFFETALSHGRPPLPKPFADVFPFFRRRLVVPELPAYSAPVAECQRQPFALCLAARRRTQSDKPSPQAFRMSAFNQPNYAEHDPYRFDHHSRHHTA